jgi:hypothetical protein
MKAEGLIERIERADTPPARPSDIFALPDIDTLDDDNDEVRWH